MNTREFKKKLELDVAKLELRMKLDKNSDAASKLINKRILLKRLEQLCDTRSMEYRNFSTSVSVIKSNGSKEAKGNTLTGRPIVFNKRTDLGSFDEIIDPEALKNTDLKDVRFLINHNMDMIPLARSRKDNAKNTMQLSVDKEGLLIQVNLDLENNADAKSLYSAIKRDDLSGMSFAFSVGNDSWENTESDHPTRRIKSIKRVVEVSAVTFPAYPQTTIQAK